MDLEGNEVDMPGSTDKGPNYRYFGAMKVFPIPKYLFDNPPRGEAEEV
jgi:pre-mRNA-splicing factor ISY1